MALQHLLDTRWRDLITQTASFWSPPSIAWGYGDSDHFLSARGYATTLVISPSEFYLKFSAKADAAPDHRLDALVRHELGHVLDYSTPAETLDRWAETRGVTLPKTRERRADALCLAVWGTPIFYDEDDIQTLQPGTTPRPSRLGL
jgi:hypothetical protein